MDIVTRVKNIILQPAAEWPVIAVEPTDTKSLFTGYAAPLALIPAVCAIIGLLLFNSSLVGLLGTGFVVRVIFSILLSYVLGLAGVYLVGKAIQMLAPNFGGAVEEVPAMKLAVYSWTAVWLAGIFAIIPAVAFLSILGLYGLYLFYLGVPVLTRVPQDKAVVFTVVIIVVGIVVYFVVGALAALLIRF